MGLAPSGGLGVSGAVLFESRAVETAETPSHVAVLLATLNGERYLNAQLHSLEAQDLDRLDIYASDDGSTDGTPAILRAWRSRWRKGTFEIAEGPKAGFAENFRSLLQLARPDATHYAFCDQDDVWDSDKLQVAIGALERVRGRPGLYCSRTRLIDDRGLEIGLSPLFDRTPTFRNAIVQSLAGGNTMVLNRAGFELAAESARRTGFVSHDWWCYQLLSGAGGHVHYDPTPHLGYRQHMANTVGNNMGLAAKLHRLRMLLSGRFTSWNSANLASLEQCSDLLSEEARVTLQDFREVRAASRLAAVRALWQSGIYRQTLAGDLSLSVATILGKV
jgi:glycosyltransferase involved in cell wall biosynthesis